MTTDDDYHNQEKESKGDICLVSFVSLFLASTNYDHNYTQADYDCLYDRLRHCPSMPGIIRPVVCVCGS